MVFVECVKQSYQEHQHNAPVIYKHAPTYCFAWGMAGLRYRAILFDLPYSAGKCGGSNVFRRFTKVNFLLCGAGLRAGLLPSVFPLQDMLIPGHSENEKL